MKKKISIYLILFCQIAFVYSFLHIGNIYPVSANDSEVTVHEIKIGDFSFLFHEDRQLDISNSEIKIDITQKSGAETNKKSNWFFSLLRRLFAGEDAVSKKIIMTTGDVSSSGIPDNWDIPMESQAIMYKTSDKRQTDLYIHNDNTLKHFTVYMSGTGQEAETYTYGNTVLHKNDEGDIEVYYFIGPGLQNSEEGQKADKELLTYAESVLTVEYIKGIYENGGENPLFTIPAPFVVDKDGNRIDIDYKIEGDRFNCLTIYFSADPEQYPLMMDPAIVIPVPASF